jgi:hypothetical protein
VRKPTRHPVHSPVQRPPGPGEGTLVRSVQRRTRLSGFLLREVPSGETEAFFDLVEGAPLRFVQGSAALPQAPGLGSRRRRPAPPAWQCPAWQCPAWQCPAWQCQAWRLMDRPWLDPRLR